MKSALQYQFSQVPHIEIPRSVFNRTHNRKMTFDSGYLVPFFVDEVLPGDTFTVEHTIFARLQTQKFPVMDNLYLDTQYWYIRNRLVWDNWVKIMGERTNPDTDFSEEYLTPVLSSFTVATGDLFDHLGLPLGLHVNTGGSLSNISALYSRAYNLLYNTWYRDQNLINAAVVDTDDGPDNAADYVLRKRGKRHDYFTSCLPWPQKGSAVRLPLGTQAPVLGNGRTIGFEGNTGEKFGIRIDSTGGTLASMEATTGAWDNAWHTTAGAGTALTAQYALSLTQDTNKSGMVVDLSLATAATINAIREAFQLQRMLERDARGGTRYREILANHFGVSNPQDAVLMRPEYLGGSSSRIIVHPVQQTSASGLTGGTTKQGSLTAFATCADQGGRWNKTFMEHGIILGIVSVRADLTYQQGVPRKFLRSTRYDYYWPALAHLGEQEVTNDEIWHDAVTPANNDVVFGYQERYAEYRYFPNEITGKFRSDAASSLDSWHLAQDFATCPTLDQTFIEENVPLDRVVAVTTEPQIFMDVNVEMKCARPMPVYSVPGMMDHF